MKLTHNGQRSRILPVMDSDDVISALEGECRDKAARIRELEQCVHTCAGYLNTISQPDEQLFSLPAYQACRRVLGGHE